MLMVDETLNGINEETLPAYEIAEGPEALAALLDKLLEKYHQKNDSSENEYYILYKIGEQRSLIKVDISTMPFYFWFYDLLARPPTSSVKEIIANFLWEKCGEKERYLKENDEVQS